MSVPPDAASVWGIVVAGGAGLRFGGPKHSMELQNRPLWSWGRDTLVEAGISHVIVVGPVPGGIPGGNRRRDSVAAGLAEIPEDVDYVVIHDAARPLVRPEDVARVVLFMLSQPPHVTIRDLVILPHRGFDLKARLMAGQLTSKGAFTGKHTQDDAFLFVRSSSIPESEIPEKPWLGDVRGLIEKGLS